MSEAKVAQDVPQPAAQTVADHSATDTLVDREAVAVHGALIGQGAQPQQVAVRPASAPVDGIECRGTAQRLFGSHRFILELDGQAAAASGPPRLDNLAPAAGGHAGEEAMLALAW